LDNIGSPALAKTGYTFDGWNNGTTGTYSVGDLFSITQNTQLTAKWTAKSVDVTFKNNFGSGDTSDHGTALGVYDATLAMPSAADPTRMGYVFGGWYTDDVCVAPWYFTDGTNGVTSVTGTAMDLTVDNGVIADTSDATLTLYAKWTANTYTVSFNANGGSGSMTSQTVTYDQVVTLYANNFTNSGWSFAGWNTAANASGTWYVNLCTFDPWDMTDGLVLYAQWCIFSVDGFSVYYDGNYASGGVVPVDSHLYGDGSFVAVDANSGGLYRNGYTFLGWAYDRFATVADFTVTGSSVSPAGFNIDNDDAILFAVWASNNYTVSYLPGTHGTFNTTNFNGLHYGNITPVAPAVTGETGWNFTGWTPVRATTVTANITYIAQWTQTTNTTPTPSPSTSATPTTPVTPSTSPTSPAPSAPPTPTPSSTDVVSPSATPDAKVPDGAVNWSVVNSIFSIAGVVIAIAAVVFALLMKHKQQDKQNGIDGLQFAKSSNIWLVVAVVLGVLGIVVFLLTENLSLPFSWMVDKWTIVNAAIFVGTVLSSLFVFKSVGQKNF
jgi:uncharacterized repeat protein (TIGR02543 family)